MKREKYPREYIVGIYFDIFIEIQSVWLTSLKTLLF